MAHQSGHFAAIDFFSTEIPSELPPRQEVRLTEQWVDAPQLEWGEIKLTASARGTRESAALYVALPWLMAAVLLMIVGGGTGMWIRARRSRIRTARDDSGPPAVRRGRRDRGQWAP